MDHQLANGNANNTVHPLDSTMTHVPYTIDHSLIPALSEPPIDVLERELPVVYDGQVPLGELTSRVVQAIYAELSELAETLPNMSDSARKRTLVEWVVKIKKQVVKLYAVARWARDADAIQKCMNITAFLMNQNQQFSNVIDALDFGKQSLDSARLRNHDLLTSLDVLTFGTYLRLPSAIQKSVIPPTPLTDDDVLSTLSEMEDVLRYRLRMSEIFPQEMADYRIANGRVYFKVPNLFEVSLCLLGAHNSDGWFFVHVEFLFNIGGDPTGMLEFPRMPSGILKNHIADEANARLSFYIPSPSLELLPAGATLPPVQRLPEGSVDAPLIRIFNFLQMMSLSYQLEVLWYQAEQMRALGWADYMKVEMTNNRKTLTVSYWIRHQVVNKPLPPQLARNKLPTMGGTLVISIVSADPSGKTGVEPKRQPKSRLLFDLQQKSKFGCSRPSDSIEELRFDIKWEAMRGVLGVSIPEADSRLSNGLLSVNAEDLDFESILKQVIRKHTTEILNAMLFRLVHGPTRSVFSAPGAVTLVHSAGQSSLTIHLCADEVAIVTIDTRTGNLKLRETGDFGVTGRESKFLAFSEKLNANPAVLLGALVGLRITTVVDLIEQKANSLGLLCYRQRNFRREELQRLGPDARSLVYIKMANFPQNYLVVVVTDGDFRYALITVKNFVEKDMSSPLVIADMCWINIQRLHGNQLSISERMTSQHFMPSDLVCGQADIASSNRFELSTQLLRELYAYCCARVAYTKVEMQLKKLHIPAISVNIYNDTSLSTELAHIQSSLSRCVPALCVQSEHILSGVPAAEAAMPNIRVIPLNWWCDKKAQVVTCVKLKYVQQPVGKSTAGSTIIRPSKRIIYDTTEAVVSFISEDVNNCVDEFLEEWARVSKIVLIAREVSRMAKDNKWEDVKLVSFDLQTVEFAYSGDYIVSILCTDTISSSLDQLSLSLTGGSFELRFSRSRLAEGSEEDEDLYNPHDEAEPFLKNILRHVHGRLAPSLHRLVSLLRDTLPIAIELDDMRRKSQGKAIDGIDVECFPKNAGWYRILYGDIRHAIDFRLLNDHRIAIVDGSRCLNHASDVAEAAHEEAPEDVGLQPIPEFRQAVISAIKSVVSERKANEKFGNITFIDVGIVCDTANVRVLGRAIHEKVLSQLTS